MVFVLYACECEPQNHRFKIVDASPWVVVPSEWEDDDWHEQRHELFCCRVCGYYGAMVHQKAFTETGPTDSYWSAE